MRINTAPGWALGTHEDQHSPLAKADQGISSSGMGSDLAWTAPILSQPLNQNQPLISSLISFYNSVSVEFNSIPLQCIIAFLGYILPAHSIQRDFLKQIIHFGIIKPCRYIITFVAVLLVIGKEHSPFRAGFYANSRY